MPLIEGEITAFIDKRYTWYLAFAVTVSAGFVAGCGYRFFAAVALSLAALLAAISIGAAQEWPLWRIAVTAFAALTVIQLAYLLGVAAAVFARKRLDAAGPNRWTGVLFGPKSLATAKQPEQPQDAGTD